ncbi:SDR family oxidoreductase [Kineosporia sp. NBRC 101731]|uniref:SDR family oxidoreductase n=1 Tax=Kineosporia sp. NBRC 101731 TaxID=3032199 RepID=UPI00249F963F|nr:SDR family oxidoreductase [Kineosporia sp. NBRC 101731]GLY31344.1 short-chain dehydrogenase [Kineosporia sp. NBRC 101731]
MTTVKGAVALVTGGQRGLGQAFAQALLAEGAAKVYVTARQPAPTGDPRLVPLPLDVTDEHSILRLAESAPDVNIVINNAGTIAPVALTEISPDDARAVFETNVFGPLRVAQVFAPILAANGGGALVDIHSVLSWLAGSGVYGASKAALWSVTNSLRPILARSGTQVLGVHLGYARTDMTAALDVPKIDPADVAKGTVAAILAGDTEYLADEVSRFAKGALTGPPEALAMV